MTRRVFLGTAAFPAVSAAANRPLVVPVRRVMDRWTRCRPEQLHRFWWSIWPEAVRDFGRCGIRLQCTDAKGEIRRSPSGKPVFYGLERGGINLVVTGQIPTHWDNGRSLAGVTGLHEGFCVSVIAVRNAHGHRVPFLSVNTCVHELLHVLLQDVFFQRPNWYTADGREARIDWYATRLWLFGDGRTIRESGTKCLERLRRVEARPAS